MTDNEDPKAAKEEVKSSLPPITNLTRWKRWCLVFVNICFLLIGQGFAILLLRFYYDNGGHSKWTATLAQNAGFPILFIPFILFPNIKEPPTKPITTELSVYFGLGALIAADNLLYSVGLAYLSASTYSLICATQLAFGAIFSSFINYQKSTILIVNSIVVISLSAFLVGVGEHEPDHSDNPRGVTRTKYILAFIATLLASCLYALILSVTQLSFEKIIKKETFAVVLELQIHTSIVASCVSIMGLFASGEWRMLRGEVDSFLEGSLTYAMTLIWTAVAWQICSVGVVGLIFVVSSLFSNVISTFALTLAPLAGVILLNYTMNGYKIIAALLGIWGFSTYVHQQCLDDFQTRNNNTRPLDNRKRVECSC